MLGSFGPPVVQFVSFTAVPNNQVVGLPHRKAPVVYSCVLTSQLVGYVYTYTS